MAMLTKAELILAFDEERITQLASDYNELAQELIYNESIIDAAIAQADGFVKSSLSNQYSTAELEADKLVERFVVDISMYYLESRRNQVSDAVQKTFERTLRIMRDLQDGKTRLSAVSQLLPEGNTSEPTEVLEAGDGLFVLTEAEETLLNGI